MLNHINSLHFYNELNTRSNTIISYAIEQTRQTTATHSITKTPQSYTFIIRTTIWYEVKISARHHTRCIRVLPFQLLAKWSKRWLYIKPQLLLYLEASFSTSLLLHLKIILKATINSTRHYLEYIRTGLSRRNKRNDNQVKALPLRFANIFVIPKKSLINCLYNLFKQTKITATTPENAKPPLIYSQAQAQARLQCPKQSISSLRTFQVFFFPFTFCSSSCSLCLVPRKPKKRKKFEFKLGASSRFFLDWDSRLISSLLFSFLALTLVFLPSTYFVTNWICSSSEIILAFLASTSSMQIAFSL